MENVSNTQLLYDVIDTLTDEEFKDLLDTLALSEKAEEVEKKEEGKVEETIQPEAKTPVSEDANARKQALMERIEAIRKKKAIQEKLEAARKKKTIQEKIEAARKTKAEEKLEPKNSENAELKAKIMEKLEVARRKKAIQERIKKVKESK